MTNLVSNARICFIVGTLTQGGAERQLFYMLRSLLDCGHSPRVLCLTQGEFWESRIRDIGITPIWVGQHPSRLVRLLAIINDVRRHRPDVLQSSHFYTNLYAAVAGRVTGIPSIGALRNDCVSEMQGVGRLLGRLSLNAPSLIAGNSSQGLQTALTLGVDKRQLFLLPNVVDTANFPFFFKPPQKVVTVATAGRLVTQKRLDRFLRLVSKLNEQSPAPVRGIIAGCGPLRKELELQAMNLGLHKDALQFFGPVADMTEFYRQADIFILTSDWEGTPNVVLEAMASGVPVVSTNVGGVDDIIENGSTGYIVDPNDKVTMIDHVRHLTANPSLRESIAKAARKEIEDRYAVQRLPIYLNALYARIF